MLHLRQPRRLKRVVGVLLIALMGMMLSACGAVIDTKLVVNDDGSGSRTIVATISKDDLRKVKGGQQALTEAITASAPGQMVFAGASSGKGGATVLTFTISFRDQADYLGKVTPILAAGGHGSGGVTATIAVGSAPFRSGVEVKESFTSQQLLGWLAQALVARGAVAESDAGNLMETGQAQVVIGGVAHKQPEPIAYSTMKGYGFAGVEILTSGLNEAQLTRTVTYTMASDDYRHDTAGFDDWLNKATPGGGKLDARTADGNRIWTLQFSASSAEQLAAKTNQALGSSSSSFTMENKPSVTPLHLTTVITDAAECARICRDRVTPKRELEVPAAWGDATQQKRRLSSSSPVQLTHRVSFERISVDLAPSMDNGSRATLRLYLSTADDALLAGSMDSWLQPGTSQASLVKDKGDLVTYTLTFDAGTPDALAQQIAAYAQALKSPSTAPTIQLTRHKTGLFATTNEFHINLDMTTLFGTPKTPIAYTVTLPEGSTIADVSVHGAQINHNVVSGESPADAALVVEGRYSVTRLFGYGLVAGIGLLLLVLAFVLWRVLAASRARRQELGPAWNAVPVPEPGTPAPWRPVSPHPTSQATARLETQPTAPQWSAPEPGDGSSLGSDRTQEMPTVTTQILPPLPPEPPRP